MAGSDRIVADLLRELKHSNPFAREDIYSRIARDYGEGFAKTVRKQFEQVKP